MPANKPSQTPAETDAASMTKAELVEFLAQKTKMSVQRAEFVVNAVFSCMEQSMRSGERIEIRGFGTFQIRDYKGYKGRNPRTGEAIQVPPKRFPFFKVSKNLAARIDVGREKKRRREVAGAKLMASGVEPRTPGVPL
jgi:integration host factor subunit beta